MRVGDRKRDPNLEKLGSLLGVLFCEGALGTEKGTLI